MVDVHEPIERSYAVKVVSELKCEVKPMQKRTWTLAELEYVAVAVLDLDETLRSTRGYGMMPAERGPFAWITREFASASVELEMRKEPPERLSYLFGLLRDVQKAVDSTRA